MRGDPGEAAGEDSRREGWVKLVLLFVALVLVAGYAATLTDIGTFLWARIDGMLRSAIAFALLVGVLAAASSGIRMLVRRRRGAVGGPRVKSAVGASGLSGREKFIAALETQIHAHSKSGRQLALHLIDIDRFKTINEVLGEEEGDKFLRSITERLSVIVEQPDRLARIGDDEFVVLQPEVGGARHAEILARRIQDALKDVMAQVPRHARPGASIGIAVSPEHGDEPLSLLHSASLAVSAAKTAGGDTIRLYAREMEMAVEARLQMEKAISDGLHEGRFELHFQPQYDLRTRRLTGFEALVRMNHPETGPLLPVSFLPAAENSGLIQPLGEWIVREALAVAVSWPPHLALSVNVSVVQFRHGDVATYILQTLANVGFNGARLRVEISEAALLEPSRSVQDQLRRLKTRGITIVLDDFGLESSSLQSLSRAPCDAVKLDRTLVQKVGEVPEMENLVRGLIGTARSFDLAVLAEGIERAEQVQFLIANGCVNVQGFLFGRPVPIRDLASIIAKDMRNAIGGDAPAMPPGRTIAAA